MSEYDSVSLPLTRPVFEKIITAVLTQRARRDLLAPLFAPEAEWELGADSEALPFAGRRKSRAAILDCLQGFSTEFAVRSLERFETLIDGEQACVRYAMRLQHHGTGRSALMDALCFIRVEGGLIVDGVELLDSATLLRLRG